MREADFAYNSTNYGRYDGQGDTGAKELIWMMKDKVFFCFRNSVCEKGKFKMVTWEPSFSSAHSLFFYRRLPLQAAAKWLCRHYRHARMGYLE